MSYGTSSTEAYRQAAFAAAHDVRLSNFKPTRECDRAATVTENIDVGIVE